MSNPLQFAFEFGKTPAARPREPDQPMRILVVGDFGSHNRAKAETTLAKRKIQRIDVDNFEDLLSKIHPLVKVTLGDPAHASLDIEIRELDDFHPDQLYRKLTIFQELRDLRQRLADPKTFAEAAEKLRAALPSAVSAPAGTTSDSPDDPKTAPQPESNAQALERILGRTMSMTDSSAGRAASVDIRGLIEQIVAPYVLPGPDPRQDEYLRSLDTAVAAQLRAILHDDAFQALEARWRGLHFLVSNVAVSEELKVYVWDVSRAELLQSLECETERLEDSLLFQRLVTDREEEPWSLVAADFSFEKQTQDLSLLGGLGAVAAHAGAPLVAGAAPSLLGFEAWTEELRFTEVAKEVDEESNNWQALRASPVAPWIGLAAPRFLLRLPYGAATDPLESFPFEEIEELNEQHAAFLWGAPSLFCATLIATSFLENAWEMSLSDHLELGDMPAVTYQVDGEKQLKPCAEVYLSERVAESFLSRGVMPLLSFKNRNAVRLMRFQSIAEPLQSLAGRWA